MIADDFKAINAAMKADERPKTKVTLTLTALDAQEVIRQLQERLVQMQDYPARDWLGDPEC